MTVAEVKDYLRENPKALEIMRITLEGVLEQVNELRDDLTESINALKNFNEESAENEVGTKTD